MDENGGPRKRRRVDPGQDSEVEAVPEVHSPEDLVGKRVEHLCQETDESEAVWSRGLVLDVSVPRKGPNKGKYMYGIRYDGTNKVYRFPLLQDLEDGELRLVPVPAMFFVGRYIRQRFILESTGEDTWFTGVVIDYDADSKLSTVEYLDDEETDTDFHVSQEPVVQDYVAGDVQIIR